ncbi:DUF6252 family protein [Nibribacter koreensis]|uniref:Lipocalin-like domain-containing protein n=1 Tax=Nibribacter koreensis TaxID=1084519 RepID=A0ABP8FIQ6_9BACT
MKYLKTILPILIAVFLLSCGKEDDPAPDASLSKNTVVWTQEKPPTLNLYKISQWTDSLFIGAYTKNGMMSLEIAFKGTGTYKLPATGFALYYKLNEDGSIKSNYILNREDASSEVVVTAYNTETNMVKGTFQIALKKVPYNSDPSDQEEIQITKGVFEGIITKK